MTPQIDQVLVLSTRHIPGELAITDSWTWGIYDAGCWTYVYDESSVLEVDADWLAPICLYAQGHRISWIRFDADAPTVEGLPLFDERWP
jgi:hypothetical protein